MSRTYELPSSTGGVCHLLRMALQSTPTRTTVAKGQISAFSQEWRVPGKSSVWHELQKGSSVWRCITTSGRRP